jgi:TPR repeat protein
MKSAERGNVLAQYNLGLMYFNSDNVTQSYVKAAKWFRKAAEQGEEQAIKMLKQLKQK